MDGNNSHPEDAGLHPAYMQGLAARNRVTNACDAVYLLLEVLPFSKQIEISRLYSELCSIQGRLEHLLKDVPITARVEDAE